MPSPLTLMAVLVLMGSLGAVESPATPPNIVLIVVDDLGYGDLGCYGSKFNHTPHIDRLAKNGLRFTDFHSNGAMCTPTRAALLTGCYQQRFGRKFDGPLSGQIIRNQGLPPEAVTIPEVLKEKGYISACFGKWHLGFMPKWLPTDQGFDVFRGLVNGDGDHHSHIGRWGREDWWHNDKIVMEEGYTADLLTKYSIEFIEENRDKQFFLYVPHLAIHFPWQGPTDPPHRKKGIDYDNDKWGLIPDRNNVSPHVKGMIESVDDGVGKIIATLDRLALSDNTLVIVTSDNGGYLSYGRSFHNISSNGPLRAQKGSVYEGGHRVPLICYWPGRIAPGVTDELALTFDFLPTFAAMAGANTETLELDGIDASSLLFSRKPLPERTVFWRVKNRAWAVRHGPWKLVSRFGPRGELYNLAEDIGEKHNLAKEKPKLVQRLRKDWVEWEAGMNKYAERFKY